MPVEGLGSGLELLAVRVRALNHEGARQGLRRGHSTSAVRGHHSDRRGDCANRNYLIGSERTSRDTLQHCYRVDILLSVFLDTSLHSVGVIHFIIGLDITSGSG